jgi:hypothetical protein
MLRTFAGTFSAKRPEERPAIPRQRFQRDEDGFPIDPTGVMKFGRLPSRYETRDLDDAVETLSENVYTDILAFVEELDQLRSDCKEWANSTMMQAATLGAVAENNAAQADALVDITEQVKKGTWALQCQITKQARKIENVSLAFEGLLKRVNSIEQTNLARIRAVESEIKALRREGS